MEKKYETLKEFYKFYLEEHNNKINRSLHFIGTAGVVLLVLFFAITLNWLYLICTPLVGYGFAWVGHFFFEKNKPATFQYPLYSLASDFILFYDIIRGKESIDPK